MKTYDLLIIVFCAAAIPVTVAGCSQRASVGVVSSTERNQRLVRRWIDEGFNRGSLAVVDAVFAERVTINGQPVGREGVKQNMRRHLRGFPDLHVNIDAVVAEGQNVGIWYTVEGTHRGEFEATAATGKRVSWTGADLFTIDGERISEARFLSDFHGLLLQLGATVSPPSDRP